MTEVALQYLFLDIFMLILSILATLLLRRVAFKDRMRSFNKVHKKQWIDLSKPYQTITNIKLW